MDFSWSQEQQDFYDTVVDFATKELNNDLIRRDLESEFDRGAWQKCADLGLLGLQVPEEYGGQGADVPTTYLAMEALGYGCRDNGLLFSIGAHMWSAVSPIERFGTDEQKQKYLPGMIDGSIIAVQGMTEPGSGSDAFGQMSTSATKTDDGWVLRGNKTFISNAPVADVFVVFALTDKAKGWAGISTFIVDAKTPGVEVGANFKKMGLRTSTMSELTFDDALIPHDAILAKPGMGMMVFTHSMDWERGCILAHAVGTMQRQMERAIAYAKTREQYGQAIGKFQAVSHMIVDMKVRLESARLLMYQLAWMKENGKDTKLQSAMVNLTIAEAWVQTSLDAIQIHGGYGYMTESEIERDLRDALAGRIYSGTSQIQKNMVARFLGL